MLMQDMCAPILHWMSSGENLWMIIIQISKIIKIIKSKSYYNMRDAAVEYWKLYGE